MNKIDLEVKIESLRTMVQESQQSASNYTGQLAEVEKQLADINKPALTSSQFDDITEAVEEALGSYDFNDTDNYEVEYGIDYDGRVNIESFAFDTSKLEEAICNKLYELFAETDGEDEFDRTEADNHKPVE